MSHLQLATLRASSGLQVAVLNKGATLAALQVPSAHGLIDAILAYEDLAGYRDDTDYLGATVGRYANRIAGARFVLDDVAYELDGNEQPSGNCLHGGKDGLHQQLFDLEVDEATQRIAARHRSPDGAGGFPGALDVEVIYEFLDDMTLAIDFVYSSDRVTVVSLTNHAYFNLGGDIDDHEIRICANAYTPVNEDKVPTGEIRSVDGTPYDLRTGRQLGEASYDHNFVLASADNSVRLAAQLRSPTSGLQMNLSTTQAGLQFYTADHLGRKGLCLEAQHFPDAPNQPSFPSARIDAGEVIRHRTILAFETVSVRNW